MNNTILSIVALLIGLLIGWLIKKSQKPTDTLLMEEKLRQLELEKTAEKQTLKELGIEVEDLRVSRKTSEMMLAQRTQEKNQIEADYQQLKNETEKLKGDIIEVNTKLDSIKQQYQKESTDKQLLIQEKQYLTAEKERLSNDLAGINASLNQITNAKATLEKEKEVLKTKLDVIESERNQLKQSLAELEAAELHRQEQYERNVNNLNSIREQISNDRNQEIEIRQQEEILRLNRLKETWSLHQSNVKSVIKSVSLKHVIEYVDNFPHKGDPDNTVKICDEYVVFDAKSPASTDNLTNFPNYLKSQAEAAKKYAKLEDVKKDIFFVVPTNTLETLTQFVYNMADYNVYVISVDSLEQIILTLKKIEEYEYVTELSPEDRDNICRILGKFAHLTKRRIQIDSFFAKQFIELAFKAESDLPEDIMNKVSDYEKSEKINPPLERRAKSINTKELDKAMNKLETEAVAKGIRIDNSQLSNSINEIPLYNQESDNQK